MDGAEGLEMIVDGSFAPRRIWPRGRGGSSTNVDVGGTEVTPGSDLVEQIGSGTPALTHGADQTQLGLLAILLAQPKTFADYEAPLVLFGVHQAERVETETVLQKRTQLPWNSLGVYTEKASWGAEIS